MKMNQKFAKKVMLAASLTAGVIGFNSMFNEAQASGSNGTSFKYYDCFHADGKNYGACYAEANGDCTKRIECCN